MVEKRIRRITPVRIEFNLERDLKEFNVREETEILLKKLWEGDESIKVGSVVNKDLQWTNHESLPEDDEFHLHFQTKEITYYRTPRKILVYISLESTRSIQDLKFLPTVKHYLQEQNIWLKIDWYNTKTESSPGFMTQINPKMIEKMTYAKELMDILQNTVIDENETCVKQWIDKARVREDEREKNPKVPCRAKYS